MSIDVAPAGLLQSRIAHIESRLGVGTSRGVDRREPPANQVGFDAVFDRHVSRAASAGTASPSRLGDVPYAEMFRSAGGRHGVDPALLAAVADVESGYDPRAVSHAGAQGLMQLMPSTAAGLGVADSFDPAQAVDGAARLLSGHLAKYGSMDLALAAYNAGGGAVDRFGGIPPYAETQAYVPKVLARYQELAR